MKFNAPKPPPPEIEFTSITEAAAFLVKRHGGGAFYAAAIEHLNHNARNAGRSDVDFRGCGAVPGEDALERAAAALIASRVKEYTR